MKFYLKIKENTGTEEEAESYLYSTEGIVSFKDKSIAEKKAKSLTLFLNGNKKTKKNGALVIPEEARRTGRKKKASFRWVVQPTFNQNQ
tara:strand:- start:812 stop:1078 length:267 start_codon:yes stop_codon:yes gene_type:complete